MVTDPTDQHRENLQTMQMTHNQHINPHRSVGLRLSGFPAWKVQVFCALVCCLSVEWNSLSGRYKCPLKVDWSSLPGTSQIELSSLPLTCCTVHCTDCQVLKSLAFFCLILRKKVRVSTGRPSPCIHIQSFSAQMEKQQKMASTGKARSLWGKYLLYFWPERFLRFYDVITTLLWTIVACFFLLPLLI